MSQFGPFLAPFDQHFAEFFQLLRVRLDNSHKPGIARRLRRFGDHALWL
jgi:hypothetical protein